MSWRAIRIRCRVCRLGEIAVAVLAARKRACDGRAGVHLREVAEVHAHVKRFARSDVKRDFVAQDFFTCGDGAEGVAIERDRGRDIIFRGIFSLRVFGDISFANRHGFRAGEVRKMEPQFASRKASAYRVAECQVFGVGGFLAVGDRGSVAPAGHPFRKRFWHG